MLRLDQPLFALGPFTSGAMLLWGLAAAVPIILHLLSRRRRQTVAFAAIQFLLAASEQTSRRMRLWQWLLLMARVTAVLLIAAALADPILGDRPGQSAAVAPVLRVLVVDASYSMQATSGQGDRRVWDLAVQAAEQVVDRAAAGDAFCLVQLSDPVVPVIVRPVRDAQAVRRELRRLQPTNGGAALPQTLAAVRQLIQDTRQPDAQAFDVQVVIISDMQRVTWTSIVQSVGRQAWDALTAVAAVEVVPVGQSRAPVRNLSVGPPRLAAGIVAAGQTVDVEAEIRRSGAAEDATADRVADGLETADDATGDATDERPLDERTLTRVQLKRDGQVHASVRLPQLPDSGATATLSMRLTAGEHALAVETAADALDVDNRQWLPLAVPQALRVVCVGDDRATRYLAAAVAPRSDGPIQVRSVTTDAVDALDAGDIDVLMLCDLRQPTAAVTTLVQRARQTGAGVVWWLGPSVDAAAYRQAARANPSAVPPLLPARVVDEGVYAVDPRSYAHPIAAPFEPHPQAGLLSTPIFRYWIVTPADDPTTGCDVALAVGEHGDPLLLTCASDTSRTALFTTAPSTGDGQSAAAPPWNALVAWPSFVPLVQETLRWVIAPRLSRPSLLVGQPLAGTLPKTLGRPTQLTMPDQSQRAIAEVRDAGADWRWSAGTAQQPGAYHVVTDSGRSRLLVVNVDPEEGDLSRFAAAVPPPEPHDRPLDRDRPLDVDRQRSGALVAGEQWFRWLLAAAVGLLAIESLISRLVLRAERSP